MKKIKCTFLMIVSAFIFTCCVYAATSNVYSFNYIQSDAGTTNTVNKGNADYSYAMMITTLLASDNGIHKSVAIACRCKNSSCSGCSITKSSEFRYDEDGSTVLVNLGYLGKGTWKGSYKTYADWASWEGYSTLKSTSNNNS